MKNLLMVRTPILHRLTARLAVIFLFAALLSAAPFHAALAATAPDLGSAANFAVLAGPAVTCTDSIIVGDVGISPGAIAAVTQTNCQINGTVHANDATAIAANAAFFTAYNNLANNYPCTGSLDMIYSTVTVTLTPGVYCSSADHVAFTGTKLVLDAQGDPSAVWIIKMIGGYLEATNLSVIMANGGQPCNVYWWTGTYATMTTTNFKGNVLAGAATTVTGGSFIMGRDFAKAAATLTNADIVSCTNIVTPPIPPIDFCKDYCKDYFNHDKYFCKDHDKEFCKDHMEFCKDHDKNFCNGNDKDDKDHKDDKDQNGRR